MSAKGNCYDNATMESVFGIFKAEEGAEFADGRSARLAVFDSIETYYNRSRIHTSQGDCSPEAFEDRHHAGESAAASPAGSPEFSSGMGCSSAGREHAPVGAWGRTQAAWQRALRSICPLLCHSLLTALALRVLQGLSGSRD
jgi:hypothetical protein